MNFNISELRVRYADTDQMGIVYYGKYAEYLEVGRVEWLRNMGMTYKKMELDGIILPVISLSINYKLPAKYDDVLRIKTWVTQLPSVKIHFDFEIYNQNDEFLVNATTVLAFINKANGKPMRCPTQLHETIKKYGLS